MAEVNSHQASQQPRPPAQAQQPSASPVVEQDAAGAAAAGFLSQLQADNNAFANGGAEPLAVSPLGFPTGVGQKQQA